MAVNSFNISGTPTSLGFTAGKNAIINGDFRINQRGFTSNTTTNSFNFDRWYQQNSGTTGTLTVTPQTFTAGAAPVAGYEGVNFLQGITASGASANTAAIIAQKIEDVRTFAGQTVTVSFWAKTTSGTPKVAVEVGQAFGTGGTPSSFVPTYAGQVTLSTSWARYSVSVAVPSISGKTLGTANDSSFILNLWLSGGSDFNSRTGSLGTQNATFQFWGVQVESGTTATSFQTATGTLQGELAACQRYYYRISATTAYTQFTNYAPAFSTTNATMLVPTKVTMRATPTAIEYANVTLTDGTNFVAAGTLTIGTYASGEAVQVAAATTGLTATTRSYSVWANNNNTAYLAVSAEL